MQNEDGLASQQRLKNALFLQKYVIQVNFFFLHFSVCFVLKCRNTVVVTMRILVVLEPSWLLWIGRQSLRFPRSRKPGNSLEKLL